MKILITGAAGFAGYNIAIGIKNHSEDIEIFGLDSCIRKGSENNFSKLQKVGIDLIRGDIRISSDVDSLPAVDWIVDCAANPSALAGLDGQSTSRQVMEHNLLGTINLLEYCKRYKAGIILLSTSRVYSCHELTNLPLEVSNDRFQIKDYNLTGLTAKGINECFATTPPVSLYGASKLASEKLILEYSHAFDFPVWINRCGVLAGSGQFGKADQGIFSYWIHSFKEKRPLKYFGFGGTGYQVRDAFHPKDLVPLIIRQICAPNWDAPKIVNLGGGIKNSLSLKELSNWCEDRFGKNEVRSTLEERSIDVPWIVMDSSVAQNAWNWKPTASIHEILEEIAVHAECNPNWLMSVS